MGEPGDLLLSFTSLQNAFASFISFQYLHFLPLHYQRHRKGERQDLGDVSRPISFSHSPPCIYLHFSSPERLSVLPLSSTSTSYFSPTQGIKESRLMGIPGDLLLSLTLLQNARVSSFSLSSTFISFLFITTGIRKRKGRFMGVVELVIINIVLESPIRKGFSTCYWGFE